jgi:hypothetical protein
MENIGSGTIKSFGTTTPQTFTHDPLLGTITDSSALINIPNGDDFFKPNAEPLEGAILKLTPKSETVQENKLRQLFKNRSNCYADTDDVIQAMDENCFIETINEWQQEQDNKMYSEEEVENILIEYVKTNPSKPYRVISWFGEFKKK